MYMGSPKATLAVNCASLTPAQCSAARSQLAAEEARLEDELDNVKYYPVVNFGLTIGF
jgi:hypothetical protein